MALFPKTPSSDYSFTEITTVYIHVNTDLSSVNTEAGQKWSQTLQTYLAQADTGLVWWGRLLDQPEILKLVVDWKSQAGCEDFKRSPAFAVLQESWAKMSTKPAETAFYILPTWGPARENAFSKRSTPSSVSTILTFHFPSGTNLEAVDVMDPLKRRKKDVWQNSWDMFTNAALKSEGGVVSSGTAEGWSVQLDASTSDHLTFCGILRWRSVDSMKMYLQEALAKNWEDGGLAKLSSLATGGLQVEFSDMYCSKEG